MDILENLVKFVNSYPTWAKAVALAGITIAVAVLVFAPRTTTNGQGLTKPEQGGTLLRILGVSLFPSPTGALVQVTAFVNGTKFQYPSIAGVEWLEVGPSMVSQTFRLPKAEKYEIRFELVLKGTETHKSERMLSQEILTPSRLPATGEYNLYQNVGNAHGVSVRGAVHYSVGFSS